MPGKAMVAATEEMLTTAPPRPAGPPGRMARKACLMPRAVPSTLTSSIRRMSSGSRSTTRVVISSPALLTRMSRPPSSRIVSEMASSQLASLVTSSGRNAAVAPDFLSSSAVAWPRSSRMSPMTTAAPARASASAIPAPRPRAPPVTRALRPVRSYTLMLYLLLEVALARTMRRRSRCHEVWTVVKTSLDRCQDCPGLGRDADIQLVRARMVRAAESRQERAVTDVTNRERISRRQVDKFGERRAQLADAALQTLAELGYARTSLREIAQNSQFSHGVLHYYFSDKE